MPGTVASIHVNNVLGLVVLLVLWVVLCQCVRLFIMLLRRDPLIGWAIGPFGITIIFLHEPSLFFVWLNVFGPAVVSGSVLYIGLFTNLHLLTIPQNPWLEVIVIACGILFTSTVDLIQALRDVRHPLWGEARLLRSMQFLRSTWASIHFTPFGQSYLLNHFGSNPSDLLQAL